MERAEFEDVADPVVSAASQESAPFAPAVSTEQVETRLDLAMHYSAFLADDAIFDSDSPAASTVTEELRAFARERLEILLGLRTPPAPIAEVFTPEQVMALRAIADKVLEGPKAVKKTGTALSVAPPRRSPSAAPTVSAPATPSVRRRPAPTTLVRKASPAHAAAPPVVSRLAPSVPAPPRAPALTQMPAPHVTAATAKDGEPFYENGQVYVWAVNDNTGIRYKKSVSGAIRNPNAVPMLDKAGMEMVTAQHASSTVQMGLRRMDNEMRSPKSDEDIDRAVATLPH
jgi:hypothetical protein